MTGREPHPIWRVPTQAEYEAAVRALGEERAREKFAAFIAQRIENIRNELEDPQRWGFRPPIWRLADELLEEGKEIVLVDPDWDVEDPELQKIRPADFLEEAVRRKKAGLPPIIIIGRRELWIAGSNRSSKTEYGAWKIDDIGRSIPDARTWSWSDSEDKSRAKQQPVIYKYLPNAWKNLLNEKGKFKDRESKMGYGPDGFVGNKFTAPNGWKHWFNNYKQDLRDVEGDQLDVSWHDEERDPQRVKTVRVRLGDRGGILLNTFTSIDATFVAMVSEYETGMRVLLEVEAEWLPRQKTDGLTPYERQPGMTYEKVRRVAIAGPGSDGDQQANILHFHISDNPYYGYNPSAKAPAEGEPWPIFGKRKFYLSQNIATATRNKILSRSYGILVRGALQQFKFNSAVHMIPPHQIPKEGSNYHILDPCPGRNWFMLWLRIDPLNRWFIYREWPSYGGTWASAYIPGVGDPEPWALPGASKPGNSNKIIFDGIRGPAQQPFQFGLPRYKEEIARCEAGEAIEERWMDSRYAGAPIVGGRETATTQIEEMAEIGLDFRAAPSEQNIINKEDGSIALINTLLDYDEDVELGSYSSRLSRPNAPRLFVSTECPNVAFSLKEWTGRDGQHGACKDPADCLRYAVLCGLEHVGEDAYAWKGARIR